MRSLIAGVVIIGIGLVRHSSVFFGDFTVLNIIFDGLGVFWLAKGALQMMRERGATA